MQAPQQQNQRIGRGMFVVGLILFMGLLTWLSQGYLERQVNPNVDPEGRMVNGMIEVELKRNRMGHYFATGRINGTKADFLLDTGATDVAVPLAFAEALGLQPMQQIIVSTANGDVPAYTTILQSVSLGGITQRNVPATIAPGMSGDDVLLGMSFLKHLEITQRGDVLTLRAQNQPTE